MAWRKIPVSPTELSIDTTLRCGQSFRWKCSEDGATYSCALRGRLISLRQDATHLHYRAILPPPSPPTRKRKRSIPLTPKSESDTPTVDDTKAVDDETARFIQHYLNLEHDLGMLYVQWSEADPNFRKKAPKFTGIRILRQDAWEALLGFICSSNNNITRICQMVSSFKSSVRGSIGPSCSASSYLARFCFI